MKKQNVIDYIEFTPLGELERSFNRVPSAKYAKFTSWNGRMICLWKVAQHTVGIILKPAFYLALGIVMMIGLSLIKINPSGFQKAKTELKENEIEKFSLFDFESTPELYSNQMWVGLSLTSCGLAAPLSQAIQLVKAMCGVVYPRCYFVDDELYPYFMELAAVANEVGGSKTLVALLEEGANIVADKLYSNDAKSHFNALFKRDLGLICEKFKEPSFPKAEKLAILNMLAPLSEDDASGIKGCPPGFARILEQICASLNVPSEPEKVIPWLVAQYKEEVLNRMIMQAATTNDQPDRPHWHETVCKINVDPAHRANALIARLGQELRFPEEMIDQAAKDSIGMLKPLCKDEQTEIATAFNELCTEDDLIEYLGARINSQKDGGPGLSAFRMHVLQTLADNVVEEELDASKDEVQKKFELSDALADDPSFYVKYHYQLFPDVDMHDERHTDLNAEGIRKFISTLENYQFK